jgi:hypothetical protein
MPWAALFVLWAHACRAAIFGNSAIPTAKLDKVFKKKLIKVSIKVWIIEYTPIVSIGDIPICISAREKVAIIKK